MRKPPLEAAMDDFSKFYILLVLFEGPSHGYGIMTKYHQRTGCSLSAGTLYPFLQQLESQAIIASRDKSVGKRPRKQYRLTKKGRKAVEQLFRRFASIAAAAFEANLQVCASCGCKVYEGAHIEEIEGQAYAFCCSHCAAAYKASLG